ncbi:YfhO family protein [Cytophaga aurantiaca]|uniref:YfhO family protein n=1 Tax=Cytophaga aurantiaca TaxID=29530 RepID=UPI00037109F3|nr:YfhO family protein [Cytophaga aurantiaca]
MKSLSFKSILPHLLVHVLFIGVLVIFYAPITKGKKLSQNDVVQSGGALQEAAEYTKKGGEEILWSNSSFSGMPVWRGYSANLISYVQTSVLAVMPVLVYMSYLAFLGFYVLALTLGANALIALLVSAAFALTSFNIVSIEAGHINKVLAMATMAPIVAGVILIYDKKYWIGSFVTALFLGLHIYHAHYQISYYLLITLLFYVGYKIYQVIREKSYKDFIIGSAILVGVAIISILPNISSLITNYEYSKSTTRGGSELTTAKKEGGGLDKEYAMSWSNGITEIFTMYIPYFNGGASGEELDQNSASYKALVANVDRAQAKQFIKRMPLYWGDQPFTSGPVYFGAIVIFLFTLAMFLVKDTSKWIWLAIAVFAFMMSWGKNIEWFSDLLFYHFPLYNKFRSVTMAVSIAQFVFPLLACVALVKVVQPDLEREDAQKALVKAFAVCGGFALLMIATGTMWFDFTSENDGQSQFPEWLLEAIKEDRISKFRSDAIRSLFFVTAAAALVWAIIKQKIEIKYALIGLTVLVIIDLFVVDKRYLNEDDFVKAKGNVIAKAIPKTSQDEQILEDKDYYRVLNLTKSPFNDATTSFYHKSIGGYSAIKLSRYQDLIENQISKNNIEVMNMLNTRYIIAAPRQEGGEPVVQRNPSAYGNAWFVQETKIVKNADEDMKALDSIAPASEAFIDVRFAPVAKHYTVDSSSYIKLTEYHPNHLKYESNAATEQFAVFSEVYYQPGWNAYVDGKLTPHVRVDYILRGMELPAGKHEILFKFEPAHYIQSEKIAYVGSLLWIALLLGSLGMSIKKEMK